MSGANPLVGLIGNYESGSESESEAEISKPASLVAATESTPVTHPAPISHCPWSACYDEGSGYTYYWHQLTNEVTWETPPEYLLALKLASQKLASPAQSEVTAEEWRLYQLALAENQASKAGPKPVAPSLAKPGTMTVEKKHGNIKKRRGSSDSEDEKIELITSYYNSDSDSEPECAVKPALKQEPVAAQPIPVTKPAPKVVKKVPKKPKAKPLEYGPTLPPNQEYTVPIGPELPPEYREVEVEVESKAADASEVVTGTEKTDVSKTVTGTEIRMEEKSNGTSIETDNAESQDEQSLMQELMNKAEILEKLGGELPTDLKKLIKPISQKSSRATSPDTSNNVDDNSRESRSTTIDTNIDDLLEEIEKKELPKRLQPKKSVEKIDMFSDDANFPSNDFEDLVTKSAGNASMSTTEVDTKADVKQEIKTLFPSSKEPVIEASSSKTEEALVVSGTNCLFPSATQIETAPVASVTPPLEVKPSPEVNILESVSNIALEKKSENIYMSTTEGMEPMPKKRKRISSNVLPEPKKSEVPSYTTKYSQYIDGFSSERTGLGFSKNSDEFEEPTKKTFSYGNYAKQGVMMFTKGETLNEEKVEKENPSAKEVDSLSDILELKLKFLNQQSIAISPVQEMTIQMQSLGAAYAVGALTAAYWRGWLSAASGSLARLEASAAPPGWLCEFHREEGRYGYRREWDGHTQWEYPETGGLDDMDICTTPPPPPSEPPPPPPLPAPASAPPAAPAAPAPVAVPPPLPPTPAPTAPQATTAPPAKKVRKSPPPLPAEPPPPPPAWQHAPPPPPPPAWAPQPPQPPPPLPPPPPAWRVSASPPPPAWRDTSSPPPPPPGCEDDHEHIVTPVFKQRSPSPPKRESLGDELLSFYSDIAELEKQSEPEPPPPPPPPPTPAVPPATAAPAPVPPPSVAAPPLPDSRTRERVAEEKARESHESNGTAKPAKKKTKVKISAGMGIKHKSVSSLVAKWQQVQEEINSD